MNPKIVLEEIEKLRVELNDLVHNSEDLNSYYVVKKSQELDEKLNLYKSLTIKHSQLLKNNHCK